MFTVVWDAAPGELCDFAYHEEWTIVEHATIFEDGGLVASQDVFVTHTNVARAVRNAGTAGQTRPSPCTYPLPTTNCRVSS